MNRLITNKLQRIRLPQLDFVKAIILLGIVITHTISFFYVGENNSVWMVRDWGNLTSLTVLLLVSGAVSYIAYLKDLQLEQLTNKLLRRILYLYAGYLIINAVSFFEAGQSFLLWVQRMLGAAIFISPSTYSEFLILFIILNLLILFFPGYLQKIARRPALSILIGGLVFLSGELLWRIVNVPGNLQPFTGLIFGSGGSVYTFPLMSYLIIFLIGLGLGKFLEDGKLNIKELSREIVLALLSLLILGGVVYLSGDQEILRRWPPSIGFLVLGLFWGIFLLGVADILGIKTRNIKSLNKNFLSAQAFLAKHIFLIIVVHTSLLFILQKLDFPLMTSLPLIAIFSVGIFILTIVLVSLGISMTRLVSKLQIRRVYLYLMSAVVLTGLGIGVFSINAPKETSIPISPDGKIEFSVENTNYWADPGSSFRRIWRVESGCCNSLFTSADITLSIKFDHASLVKEKLSLTSAADLKLFIKNEGKYSELRSWIKNANTEESELVITIPAKELFAKSTPLELQLYTGNYLNDKRNKDESIPEVDFALGVPEVVAEESMWNFSKTRNWYLTGEEIELRFTFPSFFTESSTYSLEFFSALKPISENIPQAIVPLSWDPDREYNLSLDLLDPKIKLTPGIYQVRVKAELTAAEKLQLEELPDVFASSLHLDYSTEKAVIYSPAQNLYFSAPVFTTWTMDWEGYDLQEKYMRDIEQLSEVNQMPVTHFFNPRIYSNPAISPQRAQSLTKWVKARYSKGDEIALHLHMHYDLVTAAGLTPKTEPAWGGRTEGHDVLTTAYNEAEFTQLLQWSLAKFKEFGLPVPSGYRGGGWFMDLENLRALDKLKFVYDSSATDLTDPYGPNKQPREWKGLTPQSRPYQVSRSNQSANTPLPLLNLWEYPNNGNSSTSWPASDLINRLWQNLEFAEQGEVTTVKSPQVLTYLSHPHWFNIDKPVMEALFNEARKYKFSEDKGPLVYVTQLDAHRRYQQQLALNL